ncbi:MAG TPA: hypothetical protein PLY76_05180 [Flavobacteriales bacterium]|nr:hypothetical protein [Flavobacteriales bacterium]HRP81269.1 hypothetical protein [Flavobacteriales bacterium]
MKALNTVTVLAALAACSPSPPKEEAATPQVLEGTKAYNRWDLPNLDDNVRNDTLLIYTTHALGNGTFVMAAKNIDDTREGLRLVLYRARPDSSAEVLSASKPAYDSEVMLPTYFTTGDTADGIIILANYGGRDSWGQNVFWLKDGRFADLGWLDVAERKWVELGDGKEQRAGNIAPRTTVTGQGEQFIFSFNTDSVLLYDDLQGRLNNLLPAAELRYVFDGQEMTLFIDGQPRHRRHPL